MRAQCADAGLVGLDSMNLWIETARNSLLAAIGEVDLIFMNDAEIRMLTEQPNLVRAARELLGMGPRAVVAKQGEYGAALFSGDRFFSLPAYPLETVVDPTGAGDSFAGGMMGYLSTQGIVTPSTVKRAQTASVALALVHFHDARITARSLLVGRRDLIEQDSNDIILPRFGDLFLAWQHPLAVVP